MYDIEADIENVANAIRDGFMMNDAGYGVELRDIARAALNASIAAVKSLQELQDRYDAQSSLMGSVLETDQTLVKRLKELEAMNEWQRIETAPKDGTLIIAGCFNAANCWVSNTFWELERDNWFQLERSAKMLTHWKPLTPPKLQEGLTCN